MFKISRINIQPIPSKHGLCAFANIVLNDSLFVGEISIHTSPSNPKGYRCQYPGKKLGNGKIVSCFHPLDRDAEKIISNAIIDEYLRVMDHWNHIEAGRNPNG